MISRKDARECVEFCQVNQSDLDHDKLIEIDDKSLENLEQAALDNYNRAWQTLLAINRAQDKRSKDQLKRTKD